MKIKHKRVSWVLPGVALVIAALLVAALPALAAQPDSVSVDVYQNNVYYNTYTISAPDWKIDVILPKEDSGGNPYVYTVVEHDVEGYKSTVYEQVDNQMDDYYYFVVNKEIVTVTFDKNYSGATANETRWTYPNTSLGSANMAANPTRSNHTFLGWNTQKDGSGTAFISSTIVPSNMTVWAQWQYDGTTPPDKEKEPETTAPPTTAPPTTAPATEGTTVTTLPTEVPTEPETTPSTRHAPPAGNLIPSDDGGFIELDDEGLPLGEWVWNEDIEDWIFEEYPKPLAELPATGDRNAVIFSLLLFGGLLAGAATLYNKKIATLRNK